MDGIILEGVRCFYDRQSAPLKPITLLVGENSTGKTTFLALTRLAWDLCRERTQLDFNEEPYPLGAYDQIASYRGGRGGRVRRFTVGARVTAGTSPITVMGRLVSKEGQPNLKEWLLDAGKLGIKIEYREDDEPPVYTIRTPTGTVTVSDVPFLEPVPTRQILSFLRYALRERSKQGKLVLDVTPKGRVSGSHVEILRQLTYEFLASLGDRPYSFAPIRTRPQRTYDPVTDAPRPEGSHVPMILARTFSSDPKGWKALVQLVDSFGRKSGLFSDVRVRRMGPKESGPFQINVKVSGPARNLVDVGYGVSQVLPIIVDSLLGPKGSTFLLQQPEVHLHPKAQAELGSFLAFQAKQRHQRFLIETHSDYLVDRIRMDVRNQDYLKPSDVVILYFEREDGGVTIHELQLDAFGNIVNAPPGYRQFFLEEERNLLGG